MEEKLVFLSANEIKPYENNAKMHDDAQIEMIIKSINEFGFTNPLLVDEKGNLIAGHGRLMAGVKMGMDKFPCRVIKGLSDEQRRALILADNKIAEMADWDYDILDMELDEIFEIDMSDFGFDIEKNPIEHFETENKTRIKETFECIIECSNEEELEETFNKLVSEGYRCRVLTF